MKHERGVLGVLAVAASALPAFSIAHAADIETAVREAYATNEGMLTDATTSAVAELFLGLNVPDGVSLLVEPASDHRANWFVETYLLAYLSEAGYQAYLAAPSPVMNGSLESSHLEGSDEPVLETPGGGPPAAPPGSLSEAMSAVLGSSPPESLEVSGRDATADSAAAITAPPPAPYSRPAVPPGELPEYVLRYRTVLCELTYPRKFRTSPFGSRKVQRRASVSIVAQVLRGEREDVIWVGKGNVERVNYVPAGKLDLLAGTNFPFNPPALESKNMGSYVEPVLVTGIVAGLIYLFYANQD